LLSAAALIVGLSLATPESMASMAPRLSSDLDGDGTAEVVTASASNGAVRLKVENGATKRAATAKAPAPAQDVVRVALTAAALGAPGSLLEVTASTDASECLSVWRYKDGALTRLPIRGAGGRELADCATPGADGGGAWTHRWERPALDAPSVLVRERTTTVPRGRLRRRETYAFAGFSLDLDPARSTTDVDGLPIPSWYDARYYSQKGLDLLYNRFDLAAFRATPRLTFETDHESGVFNLRLVSPAGELVAPVDSFSSVTTEGTATLAARDGEKTIRASVRLGGDGSVPVEIQLDGLGAGLDGSYGPAGAWLGQSRQVFPSAADEIASEHLSGVWGTPQGGTVRLQRDGAPPYRLRVDDAVFVLDFDHPPKAADLALLPTDGSRRGWGILLEGPNAIDRVPLDCESGADGSSCRADGPSVRLRRMGARINVR
jgi:hypothetical protein